MKPIGSNPLTSATLHVEQTRSRTSKRRPSTPTFGSVLRAGAGVILRGVEFGADVVGGSVLSGAIRQARKGIEGPSGGPLGGGGPGSSGGPGGGGGGDGGGDGSTLDEVRSMQEQAQSFNMEYLALQEEVQQENRRFSTVSNVMKSKHDTSKAAINNIRS